MARLGCALLLTEGATDFGQFGGKGTDDRVFILPRGDRSICDAAFPK